ncbi:MAG: nucleotidyltransferase family protein [Actinomycetota bacterium]
MGDAAWLTSLAAFGLPGAGRVGDPPMSIADALFGAGRHKLIGVFAAAVAEGGVALGPDDIGQLAHAHEGTMRESLLLEEMLLDAIEVLDDAGVDHRVLKGAALAHTVHADPAERSYGDNDILLSSPELDRGVAALIDAGAFRPMPPISATYDRRFAKSVTLRWHGPTELDVHRTLAAGPYGYLIPLDDLTRVTDEFRLAGRSVRTLSVTGHLLHGAIHVALGDVEARLGNVRDLALLAARHDIEMDEVVETAEAWGCAAPVAKGLAATEALGHDRTALERWASTYVPSRIDERRLAAYADRSGRFRRQALASWRVLSWRDRVAFGRALLVPSRANREARGRPRVELPGRRSG